MKEVVHVLVAQGPVVLLLALGELSRGEGHVVGLRPVGRGVVLREPGRGWLEGAEQIRGVGHLEMRIGGVLSDDQKHVPKPRDALDEARGHNT